MKSIFVGLFVLVFASISHGQLVNGSLENTEGSFVPNGYNFMELAVGSTSLPGWTVVSDSVSWLPNGNPWNLATPYGGMFLDLTGNHDNGSFGGISQTITTVPSQTYQFSLALGSEQSQSIFNGPMSVLAQAGASSQSFTFSPSGSGNQWGTFSFNFIATSSSTLLIITGTGSAGGSYLGLDNIQVVAVPEPMPVPILACGAMLLLACRSRAAARAA